MSLSTSNHGSANDVNSPDTDRSPTALPQWITYASDTGARPDELLLYALAGGRGERELNDPLIATAARLSSELAGCLTMLGRFVDDRGALDVLQGISERLEVYVALRRRQT